MHFKPVFRAAQALQSAGLAALRFNFRGVGRSEGAHDFGVGEQEDARAALFEMERRFPGLPLVLGGFSFGSSVALRVAARDPRVRAVLALGYPLAREADRRRSTPSASRASSSRARTTSSAPARRCARWPRAWPRRGTSSSSRAPTTTSRDSSTPCRPRSAPGRSAGPGEPGRAASSAAGRVGG